VAQIQVSVALYAAAPGDLEGVPLLLRSEAGVHYVLAGRWVLVPSQCAACPKEGRASTSLGVEGDHVGGVGLPVADYAVTRTASTDTDAISGSGPRRRNCPSAEAPTGRLVAETARTATGVVVE